MTAAHVQSDLHASVRAAGHAALLCLLLLVGCAGSMPRYSDALRIKRDAEGRYLRAPNAETSRDGRTLRGTVAAIAIVRDSLNPDLIDTQYVFLDAASENRPENWERIPFADVDQIADLLKIPIDSSRLRLNLVESFNDTKMIPEIREVPIYTGSGVPPPGGGDGDCKCKPYGFSMPLPELECGKRTYDWFFVEARATYGAYVDMADRVHSYGTDVPGAEIAAGLRFGRYNEWGAGILASSGLSLNNSFGGGSSARPLIMAHLRYQTPGAVTSLLGLCMKPFAYADAGVAVDHATANLLRFNLTSSENCSECNQLVSRLESEGLLPEVDFGFPLSLGFGLGVDIPMSSALDASIDVGYRSVAIGEEAALAGFANVPSRRRVGGFWLRMGLTY